MKDLLKNKKVVALVVGLLLSGLSAVVGFNLKDEICACEEKACVSAPAMNVVAPIKPEVK